MRAQVAPPHRQKRADERRCAGSGTHLLTKTTSWERVNMAERLPDVNCAMQMAMNNLLGHRRDDKRELRKTTATVQQLCAAGLSLKKSAGGSRATYRSTRRTTPRRSFVGVQQTLRAEGRISQCRCPSLRAAKQTTTLRPRATLELSAGAPLCWNTRSRRRNIDVAEDGLERKPTQIGGNARVTLGPIVEVASKNDSAQLDATVAGAQQQRDATRPPPAVLVVDVNAGNLEKKRRTGQTPCGTGRKLPCPQRPAKRT